MMRFSFIITALMLSACSSDVEPVENDTNAVDEPVETGMAVAPYGNGVVTLDSPDDVPTTVARLEEALDAGGFTIIAKLDHQDNASKAGLDLAPATVIFFGKPEAGTPLMHEAPEASLDLPQRMSIYVKDGRTIIAYNDPVWLASRHGITGQDERLDKISEALKLLAERAAGEISAASAAQTITNQATD